MRNRQFAVPLLAVLLAAAPLLGQEWAGRARMQGIVIDQLGIPVTGASVTLKQGEVGPEGLTTDEDGKWAIIGLAGGMWIVRAEAEGYVPAETEVRLTANDKGRTPVRIPLRPIPEPVGPSPMDRLKTGNALLEEGKPGEARAEYEAALEAIALEEQPIVLQAIARTYYLEENLAETEATLRRALEIDPEYVDALKLLSNLLVSTDREQEAKEFMERLPEGEELPADAYLNVGISFYNNGDLDSALAEFQKVAQAYPDNPSVYYYRGLVFLARGSNGEAAADFRRLLELESEGSRADEARDFLKYLE